MPFLSEVKVKKEINLEKQQPEIEKKIYDRERKSNEWSKQQLAFPL